MQISQIGAKLVGAADNHPATHIGGDARRAAEQRRSRSVRGRIDRLVEFGYTAQVKIGTLAQLAGLTPSQPRRHPASHQDQTSAPGLFRAEGVSACLQGGCRRWLASGLPTVGAPRLGLFALVWPP